MKIKSASPYTAFREFLLLCYCLFFFIPSFSQNFYKPSLHEINSLPAWAQKMYSENPNLFEVEQLYNHWYKTHLFEKNYHTQYYKRWMRYYFHQTDENGNIIIRDPHRVSPIRQKNQAKQSTISSGQPWQLIGPFSTYNSAAQLTGEQTNVYCIAQSENNPNTIYCGTEPGDIFKSTDAGVNWTCISFDLLLGGIGAIATDPTNENIVFAGSNDYLIRSADGGISWDTVLAQSGFYPNAIHINPSNQQIIYVASDNGFYRSANGGINWTKILNEKSYDVKTRPGNSAVVYLLGNNPALKICEFLLSADSGLTFNVQYSGWYNSADPDRNDMGGRLAVTPADTNRIYAYLIGDSKANDYGFIGVFRSDDGGVNWTLPNSPIGGPYSISHPNLAYGTPSWNYHQGFYNCAIMANPTDAYQILIGGLNLWRSDDGGETFSSVAGYSGGPLDLHVDMQDFRTSANGTWITSDGGIYFSNDFFSNNNEVRMKGIHGTELWGFDAGWNEDVFVGGAYHNGVVSWHQNYSMGNFLQLGGAEPASGYVNKGENRKVASSEIGGKILPASIGEQVLGFSVAMFPNESYWSAESSEMECAPDCYNSLYIGSDNKLWKSSPQTPYTFNLLYSFGTNTNAKVQHIEISRSNTDVMYVSQRPASGSNGFLYKSVDGGQTFVTLTKPAGNSRRILLSLSAENENVLWMAYPSGANGNTIFKTTNGGQTWGNLTTSALDNEEIISILNIAATQGCMYAFTWRTVFYRNDTMSDWTEINNNLPALLKSNIARPFYRDGKVRIGTYGKGIWENTLEEPPSYPVAKAMVDKISITQFCSTDTFHFEDYSPVNHGSVSYLWVSDGTPGSTTLRNPSIIFSTPGTHAVTLTVTDTLGQSDSDTLLVTVNQFIPDGILSENFEGVFPPANWFLTNETDGGQWVPSTLAGGFGTSAQSALFDNYNFDATGKESYLYSAVNLSAANSALLFFDRAYTEYGYPYSDTLRIDVSTDCGTSWSTVYALGGSELATAPAEQNTTFIPTATQWVKDSVDLSSFVPQNNVLVRFVNIGYYGQALYIDNINLGTAVGITKEIANETVQFYPNPALPDELIFLRGSGNESYEVKIFSAAGKLVLQQKTMNKGAIRLSGFAPGNYIARIEGKNILSFSKLSISNE